MPGFQLNKTYAAPLERVFEKLADFEHAPECIPGIKRVEMLTPGPVGVGTKFKETRIMFGREASETMEVTSFEPNKQYTISCNTCGAICRTQFDFHPEGAMTRVEVQTEFQAISFWAKLMSPLSKLMMGSMKKCIADDLEQMRLALEQKPVSS